MSSPLRIAVLGAAASGKTLLTQQLQAALLSTAALVDAPPTDALSQHFDLVLLMGLDLHSHTEAPARCQADQVLRATLTQQAMPFATVYGTGAARCANALQAVRFHMRDTAGLPQAPSRWRWPCEKCSDPVCEHRLFRDLLS